MPHLETPSPPGRKVRLHFSHFGIYVRDLPTMLDFYTSVLGFTVTDRGIHQGREIVFTSWDPDEHHQVILVAGREGTLDINPINQLSFLVASLEDLQAIWRLVAAEPTAHDGRPMNHGNAWSYYFRDPEGNRIEIYCHSDWYVPQPCGEPLDLSRSATEIRRQTEAFCRALPGFQPIAERRRQMAAKMGMN